METRHLPAVHLVLPMVLLLLTTSVNSQITQPSLLMNVEPGGTTLNGPSRIYLGTGRKATLSSIALNACSVSVRLEYATRGGPDLNSPCVARTRTASTAHDCIHVRVNTTAGSTDEGWRASPTLLVQPAQTSISYQSTGPATYEWFAVYIVNTACDVTLSWEASVVDPRRNFCVRPVDDTQQQLSQDEDVDFFAPDAHLPRHHQNQYKIKNRHLMGLQLSGDEQCSASRRCSGNADCAGRYAGRFCVSGCCVTGPSTFFDLGTASQVELSCVNLFVTASTAPARSEYPAACSSLFDTPNPDSYSLELLDVHDCNAFAESSLRPPFNGCCKHKAAQPCMNHGDDSCMWVEETQTCYPSFQRSGLPSGDSPTPPESMHSVDLKSLIASPTNPRNLDRYAFLSREVGGPRSDYLVFDDEFPETRTNQGDRRWLIRFTNNFVDAASPASRCPVEMTLSYRSTTTGGLCEPGDRIMCDTAHELCVQRPDAEAPWYWKRRERSQKVQEDDFGAKFRACNCLKQREVCFRRAGCVSTKKYQNILQNCYEVGCGDLCAENGRDD